MRRRIRACLLLALVAPWGVGCTTEEASQPVAANGLTVPPSSAPTTVVVTTTTAPTTTLPPTTTEPPTTPAPTSTELPGPIEPSAAAAAVFAGGDGEPWLPLGGWTGSEFVDADADGAPGWGEGDDVRVATLGFNPSVVSLGPDDDSCTAIDGPTLAVVLGAPEPPGFGPSAVAVAGDWPPRPRTVAPVDAAVPAYDAAAADLLAGEPADAADGAIQQIVVADLDANGTEEALVVHGDEREVEGQVTGYSIVFAVDTATGNASEIDSSVAPFVEIPEPPPTLPPGVTTTTDPEAPTTTAPPPVVLPILERHRLLDVVDLNGDRVMEVLVRFWSIDRFGVDVVQFRDGTFERVAGATCFR